MQVSVEALRGYGHLKYVTKRLSLKTALTLMINHICLIHTQFHHIFIYLYCIYMQTISTFEPIHRFD